MCGGGWRSTRAEECQQREIDFLGQGKANRASLEYGARAPAKRIKHDEKVVMSCVFSTSLAEGGIIIALLIFVEEKLLKSKNRMEFWRS